MPCAAGQSERLTGLVDRDRCRLSRSDDAALGFCTARPDRRHQGGCAKGKADGKRTVQIGFEQAHETAFGKMVRDSLDGLCADNALTAK